MTIKEIARLAGVSRGTVDRVLNGRGAVNGETAGRVRAIAQAVNYSPNRAGKTLAVVKKQLKFGYILFGSTDGNPFFLDVVRGIETRAAELREYGVSVEVRTTAIDRPEEQVRHIDALLESGIDGLVIVPINHPAVAGRLRALAATGFPVVTANSDIPDCGRIAYVGSDFLKSGETAAGLMNLVCGGRANVGVITGSPWVLCHSERVAGFTRHIETHCPGIRVVCATVNHDEDLESYAAAGKMLDEHPEADALFLAAAGVRGACRAVAERGLAGKLRVISFDATEATRCLVREGVIAATIAQEPFVQGAKPLDILLNYLGMGVRPDREYYYTKIEIMIRENL